MDTIDLIDALEYTESPHFLGPDQLDEVPEHSHVFERAFRRCSVRGVYLLRDGSRPDLSPSPVLYVAQAESEQEADRIHRQVWNQNVVPFLLVRTPRGIRLYSGFAYGSESNGDGQREGVLEAVIAFDEVAVRLAAFRASAIDDGTLFRQRGEAIDPERRVDRQLLDRLEALGQWLHDQGLERSTAHSLIGKLVYLRYLRDRDIVSDERLERWEIQPDEVFGRSPSVIAIRRLVQLLDDWLNGAIFPFPLAGKGAPSQEHVERAAGVFLGDDVQSGQLHLDFRAYDFSQIPIETLSTIYEQFLAIEGRSRQEGAFYTPIPLVNFILTELDSHHPLRKGMRVLDPACGSGAFLVQCYRRLIECQQRELDRRLRPKELNDLLVEQIFGVDRDSDACRVAELSLILTMLDYIDQPDLLSIKLPVLHGSNIYESDFFDPDSPWASSAGKLTYDWVVGNPPWIQVDNSTTKERHLLRWIREHADECPVVQNQTAEVFAWEVGRYLALDGMAGLLLPAMTFFKDADSFRRRFLSRTSVISVANFSNLRRDLFVRRLEGKKKKMELPAAALFFKTAQSIAERGVSSSSIAVFSPLLVNQEANRPKTTRRRKRVWDLTVNASEVRLVELEDVKDGSSLLWKLAMWGTGRDRRLLKKIDQRFKHQRLEALSTVYGLKLHEGLQLRCKDIEEEVEPVTEVVGKKAIVALRLSGTRYLHSFPEGALEGVPESRGFVRKGRKEKPLAICYPPHLVVSAARTFVVYSDEFLVVPPRQIGIAASREHGPLLKFLALYLSSDFARYYEFFTAPQWGIREGRSTLDTLKKLPVPWIKSDEHELKEWTELHRELVAASIEMNEATAGGPLFANHDSCPRMETLTKELNRRVEDKLGLSEAQRWLVHDLVHVRLHLTDGKLGAPAVRPPTRQDLEGYALTLRDELDTFIGAESGLVHRVTIWFSRMAGAVQIEAVPRTGNRAKDLEIHEQNDEVGRELERLQQVQGFTRQWIYFDRNLFFYDRRRTLIFKPSQRLWWLRSQAMEDADEIIAAALASEGGGIAR